MAMRGSLAPAVVLAFWMESGCAKVDTSSDFQRAGTLIAERTGEQTLFDPLADEKVDAAVHELLADGLTVDEAVQVALLNNREFQALFLEIGVSRAELVQASLLTNPSFGFMAKLPEGGGRAHLEVSIGQELVDLWQIPVRKETAKAQLEQTLLRVAQRAVELRAEVKRSCYEVLSLRLAEETARSSRDLVRQSLDLSERQYGAGEISQFDVNLQRGGLVDADLALLDIERERQLAETALARKLGLSSELRSIALRGDLPPTAGIPEDAALLHWAAEQRFDLQMAAFRVKQAEQELQMEYLKIFPSVVGGFDMERAERRALPGRNILADTARDSIANGALTAPTIQSRAERQLERRQIIDAILGPTIQVTLPIWDQNQAQIAKAKFKAAQSRKEYEDLLDRVADDVQRSTAVVRSAIGLSDFYVKQALPQVNRNVQSAEQVYRDGEQNILVVVDAQRSLISRRAGHVNVLRSYAVALADLEAAVGGKLPASSTSQPAATQPPR